MNKQGAVKAFLEGGVIAYPTEAVFGLGCDPENDTAIKRLLAIKQRSADKGLILLASDFEQLLPYIDQAQLTDSLKADVLSRWPNGITQVLKKNQNISPLLSGQFDSVAVRITDQPDVVALCREVNRPIVSTSANLSGLAPASDWESLDPKLVSTIDYVIKGKTLGFDRPSTIINALTGETFRS